MARAVLTSGYTAFGIAHPSLARVPAPRHRQPARAPHAEQGSLKWTPRAPLSAGAALPPGSPPRAIPPWRWGKSRERLQKVQREKIKVLLLQAGSAMAALPSVGDKATLHQPQRNHVPGHCHWRRTGVARQLKASANLHGNAWATLPLLSPSARITNETLSVRSAMTSGKCASK